MGDTPFHKAVQREKIEAVKFLLTKGADQSVKNFKGETPLECAVTIGNQKIIDLLLLHH